MLDSSNHSHISLLSPWLNCGDTCQKYECDILWQTCIMVNKDKVGRWQNGWNWFYTTILVAMISTHWGRVTHICVSKLTIIGSDNGLWPGWRQAIIWTNAGIVFVETVGTNSLNIFQGTQSQIPWSLTRGRYSPCHWCLFNADQPVMTSGTPHPYPVQMEEKSVIDQKVWVSRILNMFQANITKFRLNF